MVRPKYPREFDRRFWGHVRAGLSVEAAADAAGVSGAWGWRAFRKAGGVNPTRVAGPAGRYLSWSEREEIAALDPAGWAVTRRRSAASSAGVRPIAGIGPRSGRARPTSPERRRERRSWPRIYGCARRFSSD